MAGEFEDLQLKVSVDASGVESGLNKVNSAVQKTASDLAKIGSNSNFGNDIKSESETASDGLDQVSKSALDADRSISKLAGANLTSLGSSLDGLSSKMQSWGTSLTLIAAPFEIAAAAGIAAFASFEKKMNEVFTLLPGISQTAMDTMSQQARDFAKTYGEDIGSVTKGLYNAISAGVPQDNVFSFLTTSEQAALGGVTDINTAVNTLTGAVNAYKEQGLTAEKASDDMLTTVRLGKTTFGELGNSIGDVTPLASSLGVSFDEVSAAIATSTLITGDTSKTMTSLKGIMSGLANPTVGLGKAFSDIAGKDFQTFIKEGGTLGEALNMIRTYADTSGTSISEMAGSVEAANGVLQLTGANAKTYSNNLAEMQKSQGATATSADTMQQSMSFALGKLKANVTDIGIEVGEKLAPIVGELTDFLINNADKISEFAGNVTSAAVPALETIFDVLKRGMDAFNSMDPNTRAMVAKVLGVGIVGAAVGGPTLFAAGATLSPIGSLVTLLGSLKNMAVPATIGTEIEGIGTAASGATPLVGALFAALTNPATIVVASAAIAAYATNLGGFRDNANQVMSDIGQIVQDVSTGDYEDAGKNMAKAIADGFETLKDLIIDGLPDAAEILKELKDGFKDGAKETAEGFTKELINDLKSLVSDLGNVGKDGANSWKSGFVDGMSFDGIIRTITDNLSSIDLKSAGENALNSMSAGMYDIISSLFAGIGEAIISEIKSGFLKMVPGATSEMVDAMYSGIPVLGDVWAGDGKTTAGTTTAATNNKSQGTSFIATPVASTTSNLQYVSKGFDSNDAVSKSSTSSIKSTESNAKAAITDIKSAAIAILAKEKDVTVEGATKMYESSENVRTKYDALASETSSTTSATKELTSSTKKASDSIKSYKTAAEALTDDTLAAGSHFKVGAQEYVKTLDKSGDVATYAAEAQGAAADLQRAQTEINTKKQDAITKEQEAASKKVTAAQQKYADAIDDAAHEYQQSVKYSTSTDQTASAKTTYQKKLDDIVYNAGKEGVSLDGLNTSMQVNSDTVNDLKTVYTKTNDDLKTQLKELEAERQKKISTAKAGTTVDTSSIDKKITDINAKIKENEAAISSASSTISKNTTAVKSSIGGHVTDIQALRNEYAKLQPYTDVAIINAMSAEELVRNLADFGITVGDVNNQIGGVNASLGGTVDQLQQVASTVNNIGATDVFSQIQNKFQDLKTQFETGAISQDQYLDGLRKASAETDTLSRSTNTLKGDQKEAVLSFEREIKEALRRIEAGTYGTEPVSSIGSSISKLGGTTTGVTISSSTVGKMNQLDDAYKAQGVSAGKAAALQFVLNDALSDGNVKLSEAYSYMGAYNQATGENTEITQDSARQTLDMMDALQQANRLQQTYTDAMSNGSISAEELTGIQSQQQAVQDALTQASANAVGPTGQLPSALQAVADTVSSVMSQIYAALSQAQAAAITAKSSSTSSDIITFSEPSSFASGGKVNKSGTAQVHEGEYVLNRNDVNDIKRIPQASSSVSVPINIDMRGANIDKQSAQDIPRAVARATRQALGRVGA